MKQDTRRFDEYTKDFHRLRVRNSSTESDETVSCRTVGGLRQDALSLDDYLAGIKSLSTFCW